MAKWFCDVLRNFVKINFPAIKQCNNKRSNNNVIILTYFTAVNDKAKNFFWRYELKQDINL